jgi:hypothetical protein
MLGPTVMHTNDSERAADGLHCGLITQQLPSIRIESKARFESHLIILIIVMAFMAVAARVTH